MNEREKCKKKSPATHSPSFYSLTYNEKQILIKVENGYSATTVQRIVEEDDKGEKRKRLEMRDSCLRRTKTAEYLIIFQQATAK